MRGNMIIPKHGDDNSEKSTDNRHVVFYTRPSSPNITTGREKQNDTAVFPTRAHVIVGLYFAIIDNSDDLKVLLHLTVVLGKPSLWLVMICASTIVMWTNCFPTSLGLPFV